MITWILLIILGFILLVKGADLLVDGASNIAKKFHIPEIIIGLTIISIGTTTPEFFVSITSALDGYTDMSIGNVIGSNICNLLLILGFSAIIRSISFKRETRLIEIPICLTVSFVFTILCNINGGVTRNDALILLALFIIFIIYTIVMAIKGKEFENGIKNEKTNNIDNKSNISFLKNLIYIFLGMILLKFGGDLTVNNAVNVAEFFDLSQKIIGVTILAIGTSLPELVTSVSAAIKGKSDIAIGNVLGANIFNMLLITGITALIKPIPYNISYNIDMMFVLIGTFILSLFPIIPPKNKLTRGNGIVYVILYIVYLITLFVK